MGSDSITPDSNTIEEAFVAITQFLGFDDDSNVPKTHFPPLTLLVALSLIYDVPVALWVQLNLEEAVNTLEAPLPEFWIPHLHWLAHLPVMLGPLVGCPISDNKVPPAYLALSSALSKDPSDALDTAITSLEKKPQRSPSKLLLSKAGPDLDRARKSVNDAFANPLKFLFKRGESDFIHIVYNAADQHCQPIIQGESMVEIAPTIANGRCLLHSFWLAAKG